VLTKEEAFPGSHNRQAPDLLLVMRDHSFASILNKEPIVCPRPEIEGTHYPEGIFLARGPGIRQGAALPQLSILDVAPALLYSLGLPIPSDFEGRFAEELYETSLLEDHPCKVGETTHTPESLTGAVGAPVFCDKEEQAEIYKRLQALGYVE
jgi:hypothetical protein